MVHSSPVVDSGEAEGHQEDRSKRQPTTNAYAIPRRTLTPEPDVETAPPPSWQTALWYLACPFIAIAKFFFTSSILPEDGFSQRLRKVYIGTATVGTAGYFTMVRNFVNALGTPAQSAHIYMMLVVIVPAVLSSWFAFIYCRKTMSAPDWLVSFLGLVTLATRVMANTGIKSLDAEPTVYGYLMIFLLSDLPVQVEVAAIVLASIALVINQIIFPGTAWAQYVYFPLSDSFDRPDFLSLLFSSRVAFVLKTIALIIVVRQFYFLIAKAEGAVKMSLEIAEKLQQYDTDGVRAVLIRMRSSNAADSNLLMAFEGIVENLEKYRPHIPNYLLATSLHETQHDEEDQEHASQHVDSQRRSTERVASHRGPPTQDDNRSTTESQTPSSRVVVHAAQSELRAVPVATVTKSTVSVCITAVEWSVPESTPDYFFSLQNALGQVINDVVITTQASIHSFVGDRLLATWNATRRTAKPEARSCQFPLRLRAAVAGRELLGSRVKLSSMSATNTAQSSFVGDARAMHFCCSSAPLWQDAIAGLAIAQQFTLAAADHATHEHAGVDVVLRGIALLPDVEGTTAGPQRCVYQLMGERSFDPQADAEWMYTLEAHRTGPNGDVTAALHSFAAGRRDDALSILRTLPSEILIEPVVDALVQRVEQAGSGK